MADHFVKCKYCEERFNRDKEPFVAVSKTRYVHQGCYEAYLIEKEKKDKDTIELENYIKQLFNTNVVSAKIKHQIITFKKDYNYNDSGILKALTWWHGIKKNSLAKANDGIGIVPFVYQDALNYYHSIEVAQLENEQKMNENYQIKTIEVEIESPTAYWTRGEEFDLGV